MDHVQGQAEVYAQQVMLPTYGIGAPDRNPMFLEKRVYQGSTGKVYPLPVVDKILDEKKDKAYTAVYLENDYIKVMVLPELGGRIQRAQDKTNGYDFVYYNRVIKPALVGLTGPWISGGIEFNWPQHHRPTTFAPVDYRIVHGRDGSASVELSEVDQMYGTKGKMTFTVYPDKAYIEIRGQLYNRTPLPQTFLWWANPAVSVNDNTQSVFPPDVHAVYDHGKRDVSAFPIATGVYYKHDYGEGVDISRYKNIPVPTSYMCAHSDYDFVGGYDYGEQAGILHVADHHVSPGKKQWTWGNGDFGRAWDRNLTDEDGPYIELMTGMYCDNQPDFTWLRPFEEKTFTQYFMPYKQAGYVKNASTRAVLNFEKSDDGVTALVYAPGPVRQARIVLRAGDEVLLDEVRDLTPGEAYCGKVRTAAAETALTLTLYDGDGEEILSCHAEEKKIEKIPDPMPPARAPEDIMTCEELYLTGLHIEQYRHATYLPDPYYLEALSRDPGDIRCNNAYGLLLLRRGCFAEAEPFFRRAIERMTQRNPNPYDSEAYLNLGLCLLYQGRDAEAYDAFYKATWTSAQQESAYYYLACLSARQGEYRRALEQAERSLVRNSSNLKARALKGLLLECLGLEKEKEDWLRANLELDAFDYTSRLLLGDREEALKMMNGRVSSFIECAIDLMEAGFYEKAAEVLRLCPEGSPMREYYLAYALKKDGAASREALERARRASSLYCFPNRLEDILVLEYAMKGQKEDPRAPYYLGCLFYDRRQYERACHLWEESARLDPSFPTVWRNLSLVYYNKMDRKEEALACMKKAYALDESDARVLLELDQLKRKFAQPVQERFDFLHAHRAVAFKRDDLYIEYCTLLNLLGRSEEALTLILERRFHAWEGGEGKVTTQYAAALVQLARAEMKKENWEAARSCLQRALTFPENLGEGKLEGARDNDIYYLLGLCERNLGLPEAEACLERAAAGDEEPASAMYYNDQPADLILYEGLACQALGKDQRARARFHKLIAYGEKHYYDEVRIDYFAVSLPDLQLFDADLTRQNRIHCEYLIGLGCLGLGDWDRAQKCLTSVVRTEPAHQGALRHLQLLRDLKAAAR